MAIAIIFEEDGFPVELIGAREVERAIAVGRVRGDTIVRVQRGDAPVAACLARDDVGLRALLGLPDPPLPLAAAAPASPSRVPPPIVPPRSVATALRRGENVAVVAAEVCVTVDWVVDPATTVEIDTSAFLLRGDGRVGGDADFVFYNHDGAGGPVERRGDSFHVRLGAVADAVQRICFVATIDGADGRGYRFAQVARTSITVADIARYDFAEPGAVETSLVLGELYRRAGGWRFRAVGQGYAGGLAAMATAFGVVVA